MSQIITRFAPSPTGYLHIGGARTALFNWLYARHMGGKFLLRIEDTDMQRSTPEAIDAILYGLRWLGLDWDGEPVFQTHRIMRHMEVANQLVEEGQAYYCYTSQEELEAFRAEHPNQKFQSPWRDGGKPPAGAMPVVRLKSPQHGEITVNDFVRGTVSVDAKELDDMVLLRADGTPTYMLAVVVDDHDMGVTHAIRGDDHFTNKFRQLMIYQAMGWTPPQFAHVPLIHGADGAKLSKRHGATGIEQYESMGFLPEAMRNYLLRLGWSHGDQEFFSTDEAIALFDMDGLGKSPARFDIDKLKHVNQYYMKKTAPEVLAAHIAAPDHHGALVPAMPWLVERATTLLELAEQAEFLYAQTPLKLDEKAAALLTPEARHILNGFSYMVKSVTPWDEENLHHAGKAFLDNQNLKAKEFMPPLRAALSGKAACAGTVYQIMAALGREESLARLDALAVSS